VGLEAIVPVGLALKDARERWNGQFERLYVSALLKRTSGNVTRAAALAGVTRRSLQRIIVEHRLRARDDDDDER
jgi:hypothetical protein